MSTTAGWKRTTQVKLIAELQGFWADDLWDMHHSPVKDLSPHPRQRRLRFDCKSRVINGELKYVCWKKFSSGDWRSTQEISKVLLLVRWLNSLDALPLSLTTLDFSEWRKLYRKYLISLERYKPGTTSSMKGSQQPCVTPRDSPYISMLRQACILLKQAYDPRPAYGRDIWDLKRNGGEHQPRAVQCQAELPDDQTGVASRSGQVLSELLLATLLGKHMPHSGAVNRMLLELPCD